MPVCQKDCYTKGGDCTCETPLQGVIRRMDPTDARVLLVCLTYAQNTGAEAAVVRNLVRRLQEV